MLLRERGLLTRGAKSTTADTLQSQLEALPVARRREIEQRIADLIAGKEPQYMAELRALQKRMIAGESAATATPAKPGPDAATAEALLAEEDEPECDWR